MCLLNFPSCIIQSVASASYKAAKKAAKPAKAAGATTAPAADELELEDELLDDEAVELEPEELLLDEVAVETAEPPLEMVLAVAPEAVDSEEPVVVAAVPVEVAEAVAAVEVTPPQADSKEDCSSFSAEVALASSTEFSELRAEPLRVDWAAASSPASWVCTLR